VPVGGVKATGRLPEWVRLRAVAGAAPSATSVVTTAATIDVTIEVTAATTGVTTEEIAATTDVTTAAMVGATAANVVDRALDDAPGGSAPGRFSLSDPFRTMFRRRAIDLAH
jgi:outer membrane receptor protein involved in Fe transport